MLRAEARHVASAAEAERDAARAETAAAREDAAAISAQVAEAGCRGAGPQGTPIKALEIFLAQHKPTFDQFRGNARCGFLLVCQR
ncbi:hypothetical protein D8I24_4397 [Cupriavidus necator H850]|uniref:hypothetical protein n=1 Tax=Cupriavidus necator TaxID=106590 RepID=UPI0023ED0C20|nr:hypothetical protein [Cupriavidus necator]KAI3600639.1 hypothetical protein D8I24_4397 [Cupriavidus necator H850]